MRFSCELTRLKKKLVNLTELQNIITLLRMFDFRTHLYAVQLQDFIKILLTN